MKNVGCRKDTERNTRYLDNLSFYGGSGKKHTILWDLGGKGREGRGGAGGEET